MLENEFLISENEFVIFENSYYFFIFDKGPKGPHIVHLSDLHNVSLF